MKGEYDGKKIKLTGTTTNKKYHDDLIDMLVAMKLYDISNQITDPNAPPGSKGRANWGAKAKAAN